jgi:alanyl-tRNA synthetase
MTETPDIEYLIERTKELATSREELMDKLAERIQTDIENAEEILKELRSALAQIKGGEPKKVTKAVSTVSKKSGKRIRLSALQSDAMKTKILAAKFPKGGGTMKDIGNATGPIPFGSLRRIVNDLLDKKKLTKTGQKAQTRYFIA